MPLIDYDLHPIALAFGIFCFIFSAVLIATVVYVGTRTDQGASVSEPAADAPPFLSEDAPAVSGRSREDVRETFSTDV
jgi:hypothetical protein